MKVAFLFTCYNRIEKTRECIKSIRKAVSYSSQKGIIIEEEWFITDAGSNDGTLLMLEEELNGSNKHICVENNDTFYSQGMRRAMLELVPDSGIDYVMLINDDVNFYETFIYDMLMQLKEYENFVNGSDVSGKVCMVGATGDGTRQSYGGVRYRSATCSGRKIIPQNIHYDMVSIFDDNKKCHTFNANCVLIPFEIIRKIGVIDEHYVHGLGDFDYGLKIVRSGYDIITTGTLVGMCSNNSKSDTWMDTSLSRLERIRKLNSVKGAPTGQWFYFLNKNFGLLTAIIHSVSPYVRILIGK